MSTSFVVEKYGVLGRVLLLYGLHALVFDICFLLSYNLLPEGFMRGSPQMIAGEIAAGANSFWNEFAWTLFFNAALAAAAIVSNFSQIKGIPAGYLVPLVLGATGGLIVGTNSFLVDDLDRYANVREAMALGKSVGGLETAGFILLIASTVKYGVYQYRSWWRWSGEWKATKVMNLRDVRLSQQETLFLISGFLLLIVAAYRETAMAMNL